MASTSARQDFPTKSVPRGPIFPGSSIGNNAGSFIKGAGSVSDTAAKEDAGVEPIYGFAEFNKESFNPMLASRPNNINGQQNNILQGSQPENAREADHFNNNADAVKGSAPAQGAVAAVVNGVGVPKCESPRKSPANIVGKDGKWNVSLGNFINGAGCGCYVDTGLSALSILSLVGGAGILTKLGMVFKRIRNVKSATQELRIFRGLLKNGDRGLEEWTRAKRSVRLSQGGTHTAKDAAADVLEWNNLQRHLDQLTSEFARRERLGITSIAEGDALTSQLDELMLKTALVGSGGLAGGMAILWQAYENLTIFRSKVCKGDNTVLNENTCECECTLDQDQEIVAANLGESEYKTQASLSCEPPGAIAFLNGLVQDFINEIPGFNGVFSGDEVEGCYECTCLQTQKQSVFGYNLCECECVPDDLPYGNGPCEYQRDFDSETCCCTCPAGSHLAQDLSKGTYARLADNLGNPAPSTSHVSYSTGCNYVCDGREANSSDMISPWPPVCPYGYVWNGDPTVCNCVDVCSTGVCVWVVTAYGCGNIDDCTDDEGNSIDDCEYNQAYFTSEEFATEEEAQAWIDTNGHINTVVNMVLQGTTTPFGDINTCP